MGSPLFATKPIETLMNEAGESGEHCRERASGSALPIHPPRSSAFRSVSLQTRGCPCNSSSRNLSVSFIPAHSAYSIVVVRGARPYKKIQRFSEANLEFRRDHSK